MRRCTLLLVIALVGGAVLAQENHRVQSVFIYSFTRHVIWPDEYNHGDFEILVLGDTPLLEELKKMEASKKVGDRSIKVTKISSPAEIRKCNILFVSAAQSSQFSAALGKINSQSVLLVTEEPGFGAKGSDINFITKDGKLAFELNQSAASKHNLKFSTQLTTMAILI